jgi:hypothetical protein
VNSPSNLASSEQNPDVAIARPEGRSRPSSTGLKGVYARLRGLWDARERALGSSGLRLLFETGMPWRANVVRPGA